MNVARVIVRRIPCCTYPDVQPTCLCVPEIRRASDRRCQDNHTSIGISVTM